MFKYLLSQQRRIDQCPVRRAGYGGELEHGHGSWVWRVSCGGTGDGSAAAPPPSIGGEISRKRLRRSELLGQGIPGLRLAEELKSEPISEKGKSMRWRECSNVAVWLEKTIPRDRPERPLCP